MSKSLQPLSLRLAIATAVAVATVGSLSACFPLAATGLAMGGMALTDRRTVGAQTDDSAIEVKALSRMSSSIGASGISVTSYNRRVLLTGQVPDANIKREAESIVSKVDGVRAVQNELAIASRTSISSAASDATLTARVKTSLIEAKDLQANAIKVLTEAGVVYLLGIVTNREAERAAQQASRVSGVSRVVTVFEYVSEDELARITRRSDK